MVGHKRKPRQKQQPKNEKNPPAKRQRQQSIVKQSEPLKITGVITDCLENIFERLSLEDLLNVADANKFLRVAAGSVFERKYGQHPIVLCQLFPNKEGSDSGSGSLMIIGLGKCLRLLRCFGNHIPDLSINYSESSRKNYSYLDRYVNKFCAETLTKIQYEYKPTILMDIPEEPFINVKILGIRYSNLENRLGEILGWFPNLQCLNLFLNRMNGTSIEVNVPHLDTFNIFIDSTKKDRIGIKNIAEAVRLNPQLRSLWIYGSFTHQFSFTDLLEIASQNSSITSLEVYNTFADDDDPVDVESILRLATALPMIERLVIPCILQPKTFFEFITRSEHLRFFEFFLSGPIDPNFDKLKMLLGDEWNCTLDDERVTLERST